MYAIKHYILFATLTNQKHILKSIKGITNKFFNCISIYTRKSDDQKKKDFVKKGGVW